MAPNPDIQIEGAPLSSGRMTGPASDPGQRLVELYMKWFDVTAASTPSLLEKSYRVRYQVYCMETGFEDKNAFPDGLEQDEYDDRAPASLLIHKPSASVAGTVRLILPDATAPDAPGLPASRTSKDIRELFDNGILPVETTAEISRFSISKDFRKREEDSLIPALYENSGAPGDKRVIPHITLGLMQAIVRMSTEHGMTHLCVLMEPALDRLIRKLGIYFTPIGPILDYHGRRRAYYCDNILLAADILERRPEIWDVLSDGRRIVSAPRHAG